MMDTTQTLPTQKECDVFFKSAQFGSDVRFASVEGTSELENTAGEEAAFVGKETPTIMAFASGLSVDKRQAAMNSNHFSELYANKLCNRKTQALEWYEEYSNAMRMCGWTSTSFAYKDHDTSNANVTMDSVVLDIVALASGLNTTAVATMLGRVLTAVKNDQPLITLFDNNSKDQKTAQCQIIPCIEAEGGIPVSMFIALDCEFSSDEGGSWFWAWKTSSMKLKKVATVVNLNFEHYKAQEAHIRESLRGDADAFFKKVKLG